MGRIHLFEFEDQSWFPDAIRRGITDYLQYAANRIDLYKSLLPVIRKGISKSRDGRIIDLCSGGGGGILSIYCHLKEENSQLFITLTDKYPNLAAFNAIADKTSGHVDYVAEPVDAVQVPDHLKGMRTMLVAFHHFRPAQARGILENAAASGAVIGVFEATERSVINLIAMLFTPLVVMIAMPFVRPFSLRRIALTYLIPAIPLCTLWDGLVSVLRTYSIPEMEALTRSITVTGYHWETGRIIGRKGPNIIYLLGYPE